MFRLRWTAAAPLMLLAACAHNPPPPHPYARELAALAAEGSAIVVDGCVIRDEIGDFFLLRRNSVDAGSNAGIGLQRALGAHGYRAGKIEAPFICSTPYFDATHAPAAIAETKKDARVSIFQTEQPLDTRVSADPYLSAAYRTLFAQAAARSPKDGDAQELPPLGLDLHQAGALNRDLGARYAWVLSVMGTDVSAGKTFGVGMMTGILTLALTGGAVGMVSTPGDGYGYQLALVELAPQPRLVWRTGRAGLPGNPADMRVLNEDWGERALDPLDVGTAQAFAAAPAAALVTVAAAADTSPAPPPAQPGIAVHERPMAGARVVASADPASLHAQSTMHNADGDWTYVEGAGVRGWVRTSELPR